MTDGTPSFLRFLTKFTFDILPAALASVIGGFLFTQYHAGPAKAPVAQVAPVQTEETMRMVRDEHSLIVDYLKKQQAETQKRHAAADEARAKAVTASKESAAREAANRETAAREAAAREAQNREVQNREAAARDSASREAAIREVLARHRPADADTQKVATLPPAPQPMRPQENAPPPLPTTSVGVVPAAPAPPPRALTPPAPLASATDDLRPPADIPNTPRRPGPVTATITAAGDIADKAVSTVLKFPGWVGDRIVGNPSAPVPGPAPESRLTSTEY